MASASGKPAVGEPIIGELKCFYLLRTKMLDPDRRNMGHSQLPGCFNAGSSGDPISIRVHKHRPYEAKFLEASC